jgi:phenylacetate-CoA ligase
LFDHEPDAVRQFQVHQAADYSVTIRVVPNPAYSGFEKVNEGVAKTVREKLGEGAPVTVEVVESIPQRGGKLRFVICDASPPEKDGR